MQDVNNNVCNQRLKIVRKHNARMKASNKTRQIVARVCTFQKAIKQVQQLPKCTQIRKQESKQKSVSKREQKQQKQGSKWKNACHKESKKTTKQVAGQQASGKERNQASRLQEYVQVRKIGISKQIA